MNTICITEVIITDRQRALRPSKVAYLASKMKTSGYNLSYPVTINAQMELVDGGHRIAACKEAGITDIPYVVKPDGISDVAHSIRCNEDGTDTSAYDVFDYAELCAALPTQQVIDALGWASEMVTRHKNIKTKMCKSAWMRARWLTSTSELVRESEKDIVNSELTIVNFVETHFRAFLKELPYDRSNPDRNIMRAQVAAITELIEEARNPKRNGEGSKALTAKVAGTVARKWAWWAKLARESFDRLVPEVTYQEKQSLLKSIYDGKFGTAPDDMLFDKFIRHIDDLNGRILKIELYCGDVVNMDFLPDETAEIIITSPPYNLGNGKKYSKNENNGFRVGVTYDAHDDNMPWPDYMDWQVAALIEMYRVAKPGASLFYNHKVRTLGGELIHPMTWLARQDNPWTVRQEIIWNRKSTHNNPIQLFTQLDERIYWLTKGDPTLPDLPVDGSTVWDSHGPKFKQSDWHPAPFTDELPRMILRAMHVAPGTVVLDPFAGSCTTINVAATEFKCTAIGVDVSCNYLVKSAEDNKWPNSCLKGVFND